MIPLSEARDIIAAQVSARQPIEVSLDLARGRVLREELRADEDSPAFDRSAMDGYAVADDSDERLRIVGEIRPGAAPSVSVGGGECARIFTGAAIPPGASRVIPQEHVQRDGEWITVLERGAATHIRRRGEDVLRSDLLLAGGTRLRAAETALLAQCGVARPRVSPLPRVIHIATGNELIDPEDTPRAGQIRDTNSTLIASLLREAGALRVMHERLGDESEAIVHEVQEMPEATWDMLLISGGASVGDYDFGRRTLADLGFTIHFDRVNLRPGKPLIFATRGAHCAFVLPGNPVSHFVVFQVAVRLALERLVGAKASWSWVQLELERDLPAAPDARETCAPARLVFGETTLKVEPLAWQSSGDLAGLAGADALIQLPPGSAAKRRGELVRCLLLAR